MNSRLAAIRLRRERLIVKAAAQRDEVALLLAPWRGPLGLADRGAVAVQYVRAHPGALALAVIVLAALSPRRALRWARRGLTFWRGYRWAIRALDAIAR